jgi:hypothetical protein
MKGFFEQLGLAQRLLQGLSLMLACTSGCLWPTSLTDAVEDTHNVRPVFDTAAVDPRFGDIIRTRGQNTELSLVAEDPNPDGDVLHVRLFQLGNNGPTSRSFTGLEIDLHYGGVKESPYQPLAGKFPALDLCTNFADGTELFVIVADGPFKPAGSGMETEANGLTSENHWQLRCQ